MAETLHSSPQASPAAGDKPNWFLPVGALMSQGAFALLNGVGSMGTSIIRGRLKGPHGLLPLIKGELCGFDGQRVAVTCLVDTGADGVYLRQGLAQQAGFATTGSMSFDTPHGMFHTPTYAGVIELEVSEGERLIQPIVATDSPTIPHICDLLVGMGVLRFFHMTFLPDGSFTLVRSSP
jgi:hypothetical protein